MSEPPESIREEIHKQLLDIPVFERASQEEREELLSISQMESYEQENLLIIEGTPGDAAYVLLSGTVSLLQGASGNGEETVAYLSAPSLFGVRSFLADHPSTVTVRNREEVQVLKIPKLQFFEQIQTRNPNFIHLAFRLSRQLFGRVHQVDMALSRLAEELDEVLDDEEERWVLHDVKEIRSQLFKPTFLPDD